MIFVEKYFMSTIYNKTLAQVDMIYMITLYSYVYNDNDSTKNSYRLIL